VFLRRHATDLGIKPPDFRDLRRHHRIRQVCRGVWIDAKVPDTQAVRFAAARLVKPEHAVFCNGTAAWLNGVDTFKPDARYLLTPQCVVPIGTARCRNTLVRCREAIIPDADVA